ncbi:coagulation factor 5/8 type domain-containing protein [Haloferula helveola]|uniref:Coagulation factor 5/8 type domain-containing protein n=1 Tax=Haloferula helveola TaxID=490095 RepID=A0ABM7R8I3_9BACT|nr:coagulation factor 5/8 type domain-containing protein [Haloferula helveola]
MKRVILGASLLLAIGSATAAGLDAYVERFNREDEELYSNIPNSEALAFLRKNIPLFECPDEDIERTYYFRWWTYRKHVRKTPEGYVVTEFLPQVSWSRKYNTICCPAGHQFREGRWLHDGEIISDYARFYFGGGGKPRQYSFWAADSVLNYCMVRGDDTLALDLLDELVGNYREWEKVRLLPDGLFWQIDDRDGMEVSVGGSGRRPTINSYMFGDARAIASIATKAGRPEIAKEFTAKAERLRELVNERLWSEKDKFYKTLPGKGSAASSEEAEEWVDVREQHGFTPWYFHLPEKGKGREVAWRQLMDPKGFRAPFGPTTAERRHPGFKISYEGHECQWNGPSWPFATSVTLTAMANVLNDYPQQAISRQDYLEVLKTYARSHQREKDDGSVVCWIDENLNPLTGDWISRTRLKSWKDGTWDPGKGGKERGKDYNHSTFCDLVITGLVGLRPRADDVVEVNPLIPQDGWDWCRMSNLLYRGRLLTIQWDRDGSRFGNGAGLKVFADGKLIAEADGLQRVSGKLP